MNVIYICTTRSFNTAIKRAKAFEKQMGWTNKRLGGSANNYHTGWFYQDGSLIEIIKQTSEGMKMVRADILYIAEDVNWDYIQQVIKPLSKDGKSIYYFSVEVKDDEF